MAPAFPPRDVAHLGWIVSHQIQTLVRLIGVERHDRIYHAYARVAGTLLASDSDGDGFPDGFEMYLHRDPADPKSTPAAFLSLDDPGFEMSYFTESPKGAAHYLKINPGGRHRIHARVFLYGMTCGVFVPGMTIQLEPDDLISPALPGQSPPPGGLAVPVAADGSVAFDVVARAEADTTVELGRTYIKVDSSRSHDVGGFVPLTVRWTRPPQAATAEEIPLNREEIRGSLSLRAPRKSWRAVRVTWPRVSWPEAGDGGWLAIEASRDPSGEYWFPVGARGMADTEVKFVYVLRDSNPRYQGPLRFRVVPFARELRKDEPRP